MGNREIARNPLIVPAPIVPSSILYGADGSEWDPSGRTPADNTAFATIATPSTLTAVLASITTAQANAGLTIGLDDGEYAASGAYKFAYSNQLAVASSNVLVRAVNPGRATFAAGVDWEAANLTAAYLDVSTGFTLNGYQPLTNIGFGRSLLRGGAAFGLSCKADGWHTNAQVFGVHAPQRVTRDGDRVHLAAWTNKTTGVFGGLNGINFTRCWFEGMNRPAGSTAHCDTLQNDGMLGYLYSTNCFWGLAGSNGTSQMKPDEWNGNYAAAGLIPGTYWGQNSFYCGGAGAGNSANQGGPDRRYNCVFVNLSPTNQNSFKTYLDPNSIAKAPDGSSVAQFAGAGNTFVGGPSSNITAANSTMSVFLPNSAISTYPIPVAQTPPWAASWPGWVNS